MEQKMSDIVQPKSDRDEDPTLEPIKLLREIQHKAMAYILGDITIEFFTEWLEQFLKRARAMLDGGEE